MGPSVPNFTLIGDGGGHSSLRNSNICQSCAVLATFSPFSNNSRIYWSRWNMVRNQRLSIYSRRPFFLQSENGYGHGSPQTLQILSKCRAFGWFSPVRRQKKNQYGRHSASTVSLLYCAKVGPGRRRGHTNPWISQFGECCGIPVGSSFPRGMRITGPGKIWHVSCGREFTPACNVGPLSATMGQYSMLPVFQRLERRCL